MVKNMEWNGDEYYDYDYDYDEEDDWCHIDAKLWSVWLNKLNNLNIHVIGVKVTPKPQIIKIFESTFRQIISIYIYKYKRMSRLKMRPSSELEKKMQNLFYWRL